MSLGGPNPDCSPAAIGMKQNMCFGWTPDSPISSLLSQPPGVRPLRGQRFVERQPRSGIAVQRRRLRHAGGASSPRGGKDRVTNRSDVRYLTPG